MSQPVKPVKLIRVLIEQTGVETVVSEEYYNKYAREGIRFLEEVKPKASVTKVPKTVVKVDEEK